MVRVDGNGNESSLIQVRGLDKRYRRGSQDIRVLQDRSRLSLVLQGGRAVAGAELAAMER